MTSDVDLEDFRSGQLLPDLDKDLEDARILTYTQFHSTASNSARTKIHTWDIVLIGVVGLVLIGVGVLGLIG